MEHKNSQPEFWTLRQTFPFERLNSQSLIFVLLWFLLYVVVSKNIHLTQGIKPKRSLPNSYRLQYFPKCGNFAKPKLKSWSSASEIPNTPIRPCVSSRRKLNNKYQHVVFKGNWLPSVIADNHCCGQFDMAHANLFDEV